MLADFVDWEILNQLENSQYQAIDKLLDIYFLFLAFITTRKWQQVNAKLIATITFLLRVIGTTLFLYTSNGIYLVIFPNVFEFYFVFYAGLRYFLSKEPTINSVTLVLVTVILTILKLAQELHIHT